MHRGKRFGTRGTSTTYPPCKLTAILCSLQYLRAWDASAVVFGRSTTDPSPRYLVIVIIYRKVNNQAGVRESKENWNMYTHEHPQKWQDIQEGRRGGRSCEKASNDQRNTDTRNKMAEERRGVTRRRYRDTM